MKETQERFDRFQVVPGEIRRAREPAPIYCSTCDRIEWHDFRKCVQQNGQFQEIYICAVCTTERQWG